MNKKIKFIFSLLSLFVLAGACKNGTTLALSCDATLTQISYSKNIAPLIKTNCLQCHNSNNHFGGIVIENYTQLSSSALNGELLDAVVSVNGYLPKMPKGGQLSECEVNQIRLWIQQCVQNN